ncbi:AMP-binding protein, partial [Streptomyces sp. NRRL WC-3549]|uniref:AMP-binding protein n=1 Tax=Streptomyces sp. NRRL WC-3549 TaxID=1463925 RepID=UPI0004C60B9C
MTSLLPALHETSDRTDSPEAVRFGEHRLTYAGLAGASAALAARIAGAGRVAVWATSTAGTVVAVVAALRAGVPAVPLNPRTGARELAHILADSAPSLVLAGAGEELPAALDGLERLDVDTAAREWGRDFPEPPGDSPALVVYTSGTTGPPKGAVLPRRALAASLDALEDAWAWTADDVLVHALPLFHVHGLVLGVLGPLRRGGSVRHLGRFSTEAVARELLSGGTMLFGVPTMYHRLAGALDGPDGSGELRKALAGARLLVSGSAALPVHDHE